ncbi:BTAD domain-containing putative transcriptional regulator [Mesorhizobium sp. B4-1-1]|uniref:BTAD domain-containing putative transcriptional regulator n=1 Tax=Mesorhizobium sp. B4-1-1 TaxID=2589890 RepID=UPI00112ED389|nr:BTAD domain-containing putative transcriptional regulator [Mesorhizobium sp. B4-1-1]TPI11702.1 transcriptional regulator [Mesorhizobium sp. B4-1-1]
MQGDKSVAASKILLFGGFRLEKEPVGRIRLTGKRGAAIIAYLTRCPDMAVPRERLADLLWGESDSEHSRNSLRQTLSVLRRDLSRAGVDLIHSGREVIGLRADAVRVDVEEFESGRSARSAQDLETALAHYTAPFLDGFYLGSNAFDDWATSERDRLQSRALESFEKLARLVDEDTGLALADRVLAMEPTREASYRLKMELLAACGQRDRAMRTYEACRGVLKKEFGVDVSPETRAFWQSLLSGADTGSTLQSANGVSASQRPGRPSISVADFVNLTGRRGDDFFARGLVQDITTALSEVADYVVLSGIPPGEKNGSGEEAKTPAVHRARYTLSGSVQRSGEGLRVNIQLVDAVTGQNVWAQKFDGHSENALEFQDRIAKSVVLAVILELQLTNWKVRDKSPPGPPEVRRLVNEALMKYFEMTRDSLLVGIELAEKAVALGPDNARAQRTLSIVITMGIAFGAMPRKPGQIEYALALAEAAVRAVPDDEIARCILSFALESSGRIDDAIAECRHAISVNPSYPSGHGDIAMLFALRGEVREAQHEANEAIRLGTHDVIDFWRHLSLVVALFADGKDRQALEVARKVVRIKPGFVRGALYWAATAAATGSSEEASRAIHHCLSQLPHLNLDNVCPGFLPRYVKDHHHARFMEMLSKAGLPGF